MQREKFWMRLLLFCCQLSLDVAGVIETDLNSGPWFKRCHWKPDWITDQDWLFFWTEIWIVARDPSQSEQSWIRKFLCCCQWSLNVVGVNWNSLSESCFYILVGISIVSNQHKLYRNLNNGTISMHAEQFWMRLLLFFLEWSLYVAGFLKSTKTRAHFQALSLKTLLNARSGLALLQFSDACVHRCYWKQSTLLFSIIYK